MTASIPRSLIDPAVAAIDTLPKAGHESEADIKPLTDHRLINGLEYMIM